MRCSSPASGSWRYSLPLLALLWAASGCRVLVELVEAGNGEGASDAGASRPDGSVADGCGWPAGAYVDPCVAPPPEGALLLDAGAWRYDTDSGVLTSPAQVESSPPSILWTPDAGSELRILSVDALEIAGDASLQVRGTRPLVVLSWSSTSTAGTLDASAHPDGPGPGGEAGDCDALPGADDPEGAGGGGGGGFGSPGGAGGSGNDDLAAGGAGGTAAMTPWLRGGCAGAAGGNALGGAGGFGGGAVHLMALERIEVAGVILANGGGGAGSGGERSGGGGGGSGGFIGLEAPDIAIAATGLLAANGGGGGGGSDNNPASPGEPGTASVTPAAGGQREGMGGDGGDGAAADVAAAPGSAARRGGGGGGGGAGIVVVHGATPTIAAGARVSPPLIED